MDSNQAQNGENYLVSSSLGLSAYDHVNKEIDPEADATLLRGERGGSGAGTLGIVKTDVMTSWL